jgi:hypothetical protein
MQLTIGTTGGRAGPVGRRMSLASTLLSEAAVTAVNVSRHRKSHMLSPPIAGKRKALDVYHHPGAGCIGEAAVQGAHISRGFTLSRLRGRRHV